MQEPVQRTFYARARQPKSSIIASGGSGIATDPVLFTTAETITSKIRIGLGTVTMNVVKHFMTTTSHIKIAFFRGMSVS